MAPQSKSNRGHNGMGSSLEMAQFIDAGVNKLKKRIRDIERLLRKKKDVLPDTVLVDKERTLDALRMELETAELRTKAKKNASKYHMIRFFERKKALRRYKKAAKQLEEDPKNKDLKKQVKEYKTDLCYVVNFPKTEKYISLYPNATSDANEDKDKTAIRRDTIRKLIVKQSKEGTLPISFEDILKGKKLEKEHTGVILESSKKQKKSQTSQKTSEQKDTTKTKEESVRAEEEDDDEEDDFFE